VTTQSAPVPGHTEPWLNLLQADPLPWLRTSEEPFARWVVWRQVDGRRDEDRVVRQALVDTRRHPAVRAVIDGLPDWSVPVRSHAAPSYLPNMLHLLADLGVDADGEPTIARVLDAFLEHRTTEGRFEAFATFIRQPEPAWSTLACDHYSIAEVLVRFGRATDPRVQTALGLAARDLVSTSQGMGCRCLPHNRTGGRGPGRAVDVCPQVTLELLRTFGRLPPGDRPDGLADVARTVLGVWRDRGESKPYMFGHGRHFKAVKWPRIWYSDLWMLDALAAYPEVWSGPDADPHDRRACAELLACLSAYNTGVDGTVTPRSIYRGFSSFSFGQKKQPSPIATAWLTAVLCSYSAIAQDAACVDVAALSSSKGGIGAAVPPPS